MEEIRIKSAFDFLEIAFDFRKNRNHPSEIEFYRGHSDKSWRLLPSIYRKYLLSFEEKFIDEFMRRRPDEFSQNDGLFNILAKMQHYGILTRLLDVTENPAVALFFSVFENFDKDGELFLFRQCLDEIPNNSVLNIITEFYIRNRDSGGNYNIKAYYKAIFSKYMEKDIETAFYYMANGYYCFSRPKIISERILRQSGSFIIFVDDVCPKENCRNEKCCRQNTAQCKKDNIPKNIEEKLEILSIKGTIADVTDPHINNVQGGKRFIIKSENKKEILSQLQTIGIKYSFLFPELGNEGKDIMEDYYTRLGL